MISQVYLCGWELAETVKKFCRLLPENSSESHFMRKMVKHIDLSLKNIRSVHLLFLPNLQPLLECKESAHLKIISGKIKVGIKMSRYIQHPCQP